MVAAPGVDAVTGKASPPDGLRRVVPRDGWGGGPMGRMATCTGGQAWPEMTAAYTVGRPTVTDASRRGVVPRPEEEIRAEAHADP